MEEPELEPRGWRWTRWLGMAVGGVVFAVALYSLRREFATYDLRQIRFAVRTLDPIFIVRGTLFAIGAYAALATYDVLALRYIKSDLPAKRVAFISFIAFSFSNALGFPLLLGGGLRYRLYNAAGLSSADIALTIAFNSVTFWLGVLSVAGGSLLLTPSGPDAIFGVALSRPTRPPPHLVVPLSLWWRGWLAVARGSLLLTPSGPDAIFGVALSSL